MTDKQPTVSARVLDAVVAAAEGLGVDRQRLIDLAKLEKTDLADPDGRVGIEAAIRLDAVLNELVGPSVGILLGEVMAKSRNTILAYLLECCVDLGHAYHTIERYRSIVTELKPPQLTIEGTVARFGCKYLPLVAATAPRTTELRLTFWLEKGRRITGQAWQPIEVHLQTEAGDAAVYERVFGCPVVNSAPTTELVFSSDLLSLPVVSADEVLLSYLTPIADEITARLPQRDNFTTEVQSKITVSVTTGDCSLETVAGSLNISPRTLQRRLRDEETSFTKLLDEARRIAAIGYLRDRRVSISDTVFLLGFSEPSTFYRAFKRWTGTTPAGYRESLNQT